MGRGGSFGGSSSRGFSSSSSRGFSSSSRGSSFGRGGGFRSTSVFVFGGGGRSSDGSSSGVKTRTTLASVIITWLILSIIFIPLLLVIVSSFKVEFGETTGTAISNTKTGFYYYTTYDYTVNNKDYTSKSQVGWEDPEVIGKQVPVYYLIDDPSVVCDEEQTTTPNYPVIGVCALIVLVLLVIGISVIKAYKRDKNRPDSDFESPAPNVGATPNSSVEDNKYISCPYCGNSYEKSKSVCPTCGAGNRNKS